MSNGSLSYTLEPLSTKVVGSGGPEKIPQTAWKDQTWFVLQRSDVAIPVARVLKSYLALPRPGNLLLEKSLSAPVVYKTFNCWWSTTSSTTTLAFLQWSGKTMSARRQFFWTPPKKDRRKRVKTKSYLGHVNILRTEERAQHYLSEASVWFKDGICGKVFQWYVAVQP